MKHLFDQKSKEIFIEADDVLINRLKPEFAKWGIKALKYFPNNKLRRKLLLAPMIDKESSQDSLISENKYQIFRLNGDLREQSGTNENVLQGSLFEMIPELCRIIYRVNL